MPVIDIGTRKPISSVEEEIQQFESWKTETRYIGKQACAGQSESFYRPAVRPVPALRITEEPEPWRDYIPAKSLLWVAPIASGAFLFGMVLAYFVNR